MIDLTSVSKKETINIELLAKHFVEGFITGIHKSPFHGFSVEFLEHKLYNIGESTRNIDWKLFAKTEKLYTKKYEEETNLRCHIIIDNSSSMNYPKVKSFNVDRLNKIGFSVLSSACLIEMFKKQRDAVGLSVYSDSYEFYAPEKGSERHIKMLINKLEKLLLFNTSSSTNTYKFLHEIADKIHRRSLIFLFTDMFQVSVLKNELFEALHHLKYDKHEVVLFHTYDAKTELNFNFDNKPKKFIDLETNQQVNLYVENVSSEYKKMILEYFYDLKNKCLQYKIDYVPIDINRGLSDVLSSYLIKRRKNL